MTRGTSILIASAVAGVVGCGGPADASEGPRAPAASESSGAERVASAEAEGGQLGGATDEPMPAAQVEARFGPRCEGGTAEACKRAAAALVDEGAFERAAHYLELGCRSGDLDQCSLLGALYAEGRGVERDPDRARSLHEQACDGGSNFGCYSLGLSFEYAAEASRRDVPRAVGLYERACKADFAPACFKLGETYLSGRTAETKDPAKGAAYVDQACELGSLDACAMRERLMSGHATPAK